jgi:hypothetical protein
MTVSAASLALPESLDTDDSELAHQDGVALDPCLATTMAEPVADLVSAEPRWQQATRGSLEPTRQQPCAVDTSPLYLDRLAVQLPHTWRTRMDRFHHVISAPASVRAGSGGNPGAIDSSAKRATRGTILWGRSRPRRTLEGIFAHPVRTDIPWRDSEALCIALGADISERAGSWVAVVRVGAMTRIRHGFEQHRVVP